MRPTKKQYQEIEKRFLEKTGIEIVHSFKWYNWLTRRVAEKYLKRMGIEDAKEFLSERFMMMQLGNRRIVFAPRKLGRYPIRDICMLTHEYHHFVQRDEMGHLKYETGYATNKSKRARIEADAYAAEVPVRNFFGYHKESGDIFDGRWARIYNVPRKLASFARDRYGDLVLRGYSPKSTQTMMKIVKKVLSK